ncbi:MAG TPA: hypothetical protein VF452_20990, partial [Candidatus Binatia bacterium]
MHLDLLNKQCRTLRQLDIAPAKLSTSYLRNFFWVATFMAVLLINLVQAHAARQKAPRKETAKAKSTAKPVSNRPGTIRESRPLLGSSFLTLPDIFEKRQHMTERVRPGETVAQFLRRYGVSGADQQIWNRSISRNLGRQTLPAGREIHLYFAQPTLRRQNKLIPGQLTALELDQDDDSTLAWEKSLRGILFQKREKPYDVELKTASGAVETSLFEDGQRAGLQATLVSQLADIFTWDIDIEKDIQKGDTFKILYEERSRKGQAKSALRILAAELMNAGQKLTAVYFEKQ